MAETTSRGVVVALVEGRGAAAHVQDDDAIGDLEDDVDVVGDHHDAEPLGAESPDEGEDLRGLA